MAKTNLTDRKIVAVRGTVQGARLRTPEVPVVGEEYDNRPGPTGSEAVDPGAGESTSIGVPRNIAIESQEVRIQPDGSAVVDVTISFEPADGAVRHELRQSRL